MDFSDKKQGETISLGFDLFGMLLPGELPQTIVFSNNSPGDSSAETMLSGLGSISGTRVSQRITGGIPDSVYVLQVTVTTTQGNVYIERGSYRVIA